MEIFLRVDLGDLSKIKEARDYLNDHCEPGGAKTAPPKTAGKGKGGGKAAKPAADGPSKDDVKDALTKCIAADKKDEVVALLAEYDAKRLSDLDKQPEHYPNILKACEAIMDVDDEPIV